MSIIGVLVREGTTDSFVDLLYKIFLHLGIDNIKIEAPDLSGIATGLSVKEKIKAATLLVPNATLVFVHRDSDRLPPSHRRKEIQDAMDDLKVEHHFIAIIPVRSTEAWLLLDEEAIRAVSGNPNGRMNLNLPTLQKVEEIHDPKKVLADILSTASGLGGRRLHEFRTHKNFADQRRQLLEDLEPKGSILKVPSFKQLMENISSFINSVTPS